MKLLQAMSENEKHLQVSKLELRNKNSNKECWKTEPFYIGLCWKCSLLLL